MLGLEPNSPINQSYLKERLGFYPFDLINISGDSPQPLREEVAIGDSVLHSVVSAVRDEAGELRGVAVVLRGLYRGEGARRATTRVCLGCQPRAANSADLDHRRPRHCAVGIRGSLEPKTAPLPNTGA